MGKESHFRPQHISRFLQSQEGAHFPKLALRIGRIRTLSGNAGPAPVALVGRVTWDGIGNCSRLSDGEHRGRGGSCHLRGDLQGEQRLHRIEDLHFRGVGLMPIVHFDFAITNGGNEIQVISTDPGLALTASATRLANGWDRDYAVSSGSRSAPSAVGDGCRDESGKAHDLYRANYRSRGRSWIETAQEKSLLP